MTASGMPRAHDVPVDIELLLDIVAATAGGSGVESVAAAVAPLITAATATDACFVHVLDDCNRSLTLAGATPPFDEEVGHVRLPLGSGICGWVASHREPAVIVGDKEDDPRYEPIEAMYGPASTSMAAVPMETAPGGLVGVLSVHTIEGRNFTERDIKLLLVTGRLIAGALYQARLNRQLTVRERAHEDFAEQVIAAQEIERRRLAGDIHDGISQRLVTLTYRLDAAAQAVHDDPTAAAEQIEKARELVGLTMDEARSAISGLRPPVLDDLGLSGGLASLAASIPGVDFDLELDDDRLPEHIEVALYRIAQECLQNIVKHSHARMASLRFTVFGGVAHLDVTDDGIGFDARADRAPGSRPGGYGMLSMAERAELVGGRLSVRSRPGSGVIVTVTIPLDAVTMTPIG